MTLADALAAALALDDLVPMPAGSPFYRDLAERVFADPAFLAALTESIAEAMHDPYGNESYNFVPDHSAYGRWGRCAACGEDGVWAGSLDAAGVVSRMVG